MALALAGVAIAQDGPLQRAGQVLDRTGKNIRARVETEIARGQLAAEERDVLHRVLRRIEWDKRGKRSLPRGTNENRRSPARLVERSMRSARVRPG